VSFSNVSIRNTAYASDPETGASVLEVRDHHALIMAAGYLKFRFANNEDEGIYFRGQRKLYGSLSPTLFRGIKTQKTCDKCISHLRKVMDQYREKCGIFEKFGSWSHEALLQHYGISTTWIDLVDNVWVALWFACHRAVSSGKNDEFLHFEKRVYGTNDVYAYILLIGVDIKKRNSRKPGYYTGDNTELLDLRMAAPSIFLRPHAQHGWLFRCKGGVSERSTDYSDRIRGILRIRLNDAMEWLGSGKMLSTHSLFPPPYYDEGYKILVSNAASITSSVGKIQYIGA
jgi:hypothetical protein